MTSPSFPLGLLFCRYKDKIDPVLLKKRTILILLSISVMLCSPFVSKYTVKVGHTVIFDLLMTAESLSFLVFMVSFLSTSKAENFLSCGFMLWLGRISLAIYGVQGFFIAFLRSTVVYVENNFVFAIMVLVLSIIAAIPITVIIEKCYSICRE